MPVDRCHFFGGNRHPGSFRIRDGLGGGFGQVIHVLVGMTVWAVIVRMGMGMHN